MFFQKRSSVIGLRERQCWLGSLVGEWSGELGGDLCKVGDQEMSSIPMHASCHGNRSGEVLSQGSFSNI